MAGLANESDNVNISNSSSSQTLNESTTEATISATESMVIT